MIYRFQVTLEWTAFLLSLRHMLHHLNGPPTGFVTGFRAFMDRSHSKHGTDDPVRSGFVEFDMWLATYSPYMFNMSNSFINSHDLHSSHHPWLTQYNAQWYHLRKPALRVLRTHPRFPYEKIHQRLQILLHSAIVALSSLAQPIALPQLNNKSSDKLQISDVNIHRLHLFNLLSELLSYLPTPSPSGTQTTTNSPALSNVTPLENSHKPMLSAAKKSRDKNESKASNAGRSTESSSQPMEATSSMLSPSPLSSSSSSTSSTSIPNNNPGSNSATTTQDTPRSDANRIVLTLNSPSCIHELRCKLQEYFSFADDQIRTVEEESFLSPTPTPTPSPFSSSQLSQESSSGSAQEICQAYLLKTASMILAAESMGL